MSNKSTIATIKQIVNVEKNENVSGKFFEIPPYQRLYEWEKEQIETLLDDMKKAWKPDDCQSDKSNEDSQKSSKQYFIGNITTSKKSENEGEKFILIDGQQRLTTLWFIGFYLASLEYEWETKDKKYKKVWQDFILQNDNLRIAMPIRDNEEKALKELAKKIAELKDNKDKYNLADSLPSNIHTKIRNAFECIEIWFNNAENIQESEVKDFAEFIYTKVCFVFVELAQNTDLNRFFVRMNNRGKQLEQHEILKARILHKISEKEREKYAEIWDLCSNMNRYIFQSKDSEIYEVESIIDFPTFLLHCYKLWVMRQENEKAPQVIQINRNKLLDMIEPDKKDNKWSNDKAKNFIESMLRYRVLFDGFVIKFTAKKGKETSEKESPYKIKRLSSDDNLVNSNLSDLEMIQNYLRVARQGDRQNYHHWLTPFLIYLDSEKICKQIWKDYICKDNFGEIAALFKTDTANEQNLYNETNMIKFLENLDTKLAIAQLPKQDNKDEKNKNLKMLTIASEVLQNLDSVKDFKVDEEFYKNDKWNFLKYGNDIRYWFYRLEYYLWKWGNKEQRKGIKNDTINKIFKEFDDLEFPKDKGNKFKFDKILGSFYFRNLNSIEHIQPQSRAEDKDWKIHNKGTKDEKRDIDCFGNLALLSIGFNSSLSNQDNADKRLDLQKKINKSEVESLKLWLVYADYPKDEDWTYANAQSHQNQMLDILIKSLS